MATVKMRTPRKPYDIDLEETFYVNATTNEIRKEAPAFGSNDPRRYPEMRDFYGLEEVKKNQE